MMSVSVFFTSQALTNSVTQSQKRVGIGGRKKDSSLPDTNPIGPFNTFYEAERNANERSDGYTVWRTI